MQIPIHQLSLFIRWNNQLVKIEHIRNRFESHCVHSQRAIKEKKKSILFPFATRQFSILFAICFVFILVLFFFCVLIFVCLMSSFFVQAHSKIDHFTHHHHRLCFIPVLVVSHTFFFQITNIFLTALTPTYVLFVLCLHAIFSFRFALAFSAEPILMEINFIGCIFYGI